jgi:putative membrane protein
MAQQEETFGGQQGNENTAPRGQRVAAGGRAFSKKVSDHLANERTFLAWIRTGLAVIGFGFVIERFGLLIRDITVRINGHALSTGLYSTIIGVTLTLLGTTVVVVGLFSFLQNQRAIDKEQFRPSRAFAIILTCLTGLIGLVLAAYLLFTA